MRNVYPTHKVHITVLSLPTCCLGPGDSLLGVAGSCPAHCRVLNGILGFLPTRRSEASLPQCDNHKGSQKDKITPYPTEDHYPIQSNRNKPPSTWEKLCVYKVYQAAKGRGRITFSLLISSIHMPLAQVWSLTPKSPLPCSLFLP